MNVSISSNVELDLLLEPISAARPAGELLRYDGTYDRIQEARREDDQRLSQGIYQTSHKRADWETGEAICLEALEKRTKDLQIAGWLLEAWLHLRGFRGVEAGLRLLTGLCERFWTEMHPELEGDNFEARIAPLEWINRKLAFSLKQIPLTLPFEREGRLLPFQAGGGDQHSFIACYCSHGGERVHGLRARGARNKLHGKRGEAAGNDRLQRGRLIQRLQESKDDRARPHPDPGLGDHLDGRTKSAGVPAGPDAARRVIPPSR